MLLHLHFELSYFTLRTMKPRPVDPNIPPSPYDVVEQHCNGGGGDVDDRKLLLKIICANSRAVYSLWQLFLSIIVELTFPKCLLKVE